MEQDFTIKFVETISTKLWKGEKEMFQAFLIGLGITAIWLFTSLLIYAGYYILSFMTVVPEGVIFTFTDAISYGEIIVIALIIAGIVSAILNALGIIDIKAILPIKKKKI